jgi:DNA (cytosine-5)-methyltransferase 1
MNGVDLFCGGGGATRGYVLAEHTMRGVDTNGKLEADYLRSGGARFACGDVLEFLAEHGNHPGIGFFHASPPCQRYSAMTRSRPGKAAEYPDLIGPTRELLIATGKPYIIENVEEARAWLKDPVTLCGFQFGLPSYRHRLFEAGGGLVLAGPPAPPPPEDNRPQAAAACRALGFECQAELSTRPQDCGWPHPEPAAKAGHWETGHFVSPSGNEYKRPSEVGLGIGWMRNRAARGEAIPPAFTRWIGRQL